MKKFTPLVLVAALALTFTSCKKRYNCVCEDSAGNEISNTDLSEFKTTAKTLCASSSALAASSSGGSCKLK
ncbi:MAG TPA: hypothetical protein VEB40_09595 [Flavipsychrobacter sp.]|nr:hypothetical protein [Flavipsychrobacter sp.]